MGVMVNEKEVYNKVISAVDAMLRTFNRSVSFKLVGTTNIYTDLGIDSVELMDLLGFIEREFSITIDAEKVAGSKTINDIVDFVVGVLKMKNK